MGARAEAEQRRARLDDAAHVDADGERVDERQVLEARLQRALGAQDQAPHQHEHEHGHDAREDGRDEPGRHLNESRPL